MKRGGARNRGDRTSERLTEKHCRDLINAAEAAWQAGQPLNRFMTIHWQKGGIDARGCVIATGAFVKLASDWAARHGYRLGWLWVQEWGHGYGAHVHLLMHVPRVLNPLFRPMPLRWVKSILPGAYVKGVHKSETIRGAGSAQANPNAYWRELDGKLHYVMKAAPPELEAKLDMQGRGRKKWGRYCMVYGKRAAQAQWLRNAGQPVK